MALLRAVMGCTAEGAFYGKRRPSSQSGAKLLHVTDLFLLGRTTIEEARALLHWTRQQVPQVVT
jgi:hypothetical protein